MNLRRRQSAFTLIELLVVIAIIGILAAIVGPSLGHFRKGDAMLAGTRQMLDGVARARQLAISQRTTVCMVFVPPSFWTDPAFSNPNFVQADLVAATNLLEKQFVGFNFVALRSAGDQPGQSTAHYLSTWQNLPQSTFIWTNKFFINYTQFTNSALTLGYPVTQFLYTNTIPFPLEGTKPPPNGSSYLYIWLPYIAFDFQGRLVDATGRLLGRDEFVPLAHGSVAPAINPKTRVSQLGIASVQEQPVGNSTNAYNLIHIDWLTGRARHEHQEVQ